jgi:hypothetical protein
VRFDFSKRSCEFKTFNNRVENMGPEEKRKAIDLPARWQIKAKELDILVPTQGVPLSQFLFGTDLRKPALQCPLLSPLKVFRRPEHVTLTIYDDGVDKRKKLTFTDCKVKDPIIEFDQDAIFVVCKFQIHPDGHLQRINDNVENKTLQFECKATQPELFDEKDDEEEDEEKDGQGDLVGKDEEEDEGNEEEEDEEDEDD